MAPSPDSELPLFPLALVLLPGELLPLHIFEPRYQRLLATCRETGESFGIVLFGRGGMATTGCTARLVTVLSEYGDGRADIVVRGDARFRVLELRPPEDIQAEPLRASVEYLEDTGVAASGRVTEAEALFARVLELTESDPPAATPADLPTSFRLAGAVELELPLKQQLLQLDDEGERLDLLAEALRSLITRVEVFRSREDAIRGNGKGY